MHLSIYKHNCCKRGNKMKIIKCRIADFNITFHTELTQFNTIMKEYISDFDVADFDFNLSQTQITNEKKEYKFIETNDRHAIFESAALLREFAEQLPKHNAFLLHSACFSVEGIGVAFTAVSGTGKTTHMKLWKKHLCKKLTAINGDKPIIRFFENEPETPYAYGTPWNGKERYGHNLRTKLQHICFIERSETNFVEQIKKEDAINLLFKQVYASKDPVVMMNTIKLIDRLLNCCKLWKIHCNMEVEAAQIAYEAIFNGNF